MPEKKKKGKVYILPKIKQSKRDRRSKLQAIIKVKILTIYLMANWRAMLWYFVMFEGML